MSLTHRPTHKLRVSREIARAFDELPEVMLSVLRHGNLGEDVVVEVDDATWEQYRDARGSVQERRMRDVLALEAARRAATNGFKRSAGTLFVTEKETRCPSCGKPVKPNTVAVNATTRDQTATRAYHIDCANSEAIPLQATDTKLNEDGLGRMGRRLIAGLERFFRLREGG